MRDRPTVDDWIRGVLSGSGLPMARRAEIADEWRDHLRQRIEAKSAGGMTLNDAVQAALNDFGDPTRLRRELRRGQHACDLRRAVDKTRPIAAWTLGAALCAAGLTAVCLPGSAPAVERLAGGCIIFFPLALFAIVPAFLASFVELGVTRSRPVEEFHPVRSFLRWSCVVAAFLAGILLSTVVAVGLCAYLAPHSVFLSALHPNPEIMYGAPWLIWRHIAVAACRFHVSNCVIPPLMIFVGAWAITRYERSRCVDTKADVAES